MVRALVILAAASLALMAVRRIAGRAIRARRNAALDRQARQGGPVPTLREDPATGVYRIERDSRR